MYYSVDMVKLKSYPIIRPYKMGMQSTFFENEHEKIFSSLIGFNNYLDLKKQDCIKYWTDTRFKYYKHNWIIEFPCGGTCFVAYKHNSQKSDSTPQLFLKFNPNKMDLSISIYKPLVALVYRCGKNSITEVDIAVDIERSIDNLIIEKPKRLQNYKYFQSPKGKTHYYGNRSNLIKVYDKASEMGLEKGYPLTRVEFTLQVVNNRLNKSQIRDINIFDIGGTQIGFNLEKENKTLNAVVYAIYMGYDINRLTDYQRRKVKKYLHSAGTLVDIDKTKMIECFNLFVKDLNNIIDKYNFNYLCV